MTCIVSLFTAFLVCIKINKMYIPKEYKHENAEEIFRFITANGFATLVSTVDDKPWATHIPLVLKDDKTLEGHISKANAQWKSFEKQPEVLTIFQGAHTYVSSSWYDHENAPTWNYIAVHIYGKVRLVSEEELRKSLSRLVNKYEAQSEKSIAVERMSAEFLDKEIRGIVGFEIAITDIQAVAKLSQNRDEKNHTAIINELEKRGDSASLEVARLMKEKNKLS